jgi:hypothetical protein
MFKSFQIQIQIHQNNTHTYETLQTDLDPPGKSYLTLTSSY